MHEYYRNKAPKLKKAMNVFLKLISESGRRRTALLSASCPIIMIIAWRKQSTFRLFSPQNDKFCGE